MQETFTREEALDLLLKYNQEPFHIRHGLTVEGAMRWLAADQGEAENADYWGLVGLLHDVDYEKWPDQHCHKARELLKEIGASDAFIYSVCCHAYGHGSELEPKENMEKVLYAVDELTGLIWAATLLRPSKSTQDMTPKSVKKKFKDKAFAAGCNREIIQEGADRLGWDIGTLEEKTLAAMQASEDFVASEMDRLVAEGRIAAEA